MSEFLVNLLGERLARAGAGDDDDDDAAAAEVDVHALGARLSLLGLYFGCSLNEPCRQFNGSLRDFYSKFKATSEHRDELEVVFISSDQDQKHWRDFLQEMQWPALPFKERHKKLLDDWLEACIALNSTERRFSLTSRRSAPAGQRNETKHRTKNILV